MAVVIDFSPDWKRRGVRPSRAPTARDRLKLTSQWSTARAVTLQPAEGPNSFSNAAFVAVPRGRRHSSGDRVKYADSRELKSIDSDPLVLMGHRDSRVKQMKRVRHTAPAVRGVRSLKEPAGVKEPGFANLRCFIARRKAVQLAKNGDVQMLKFLLSRSMPRERLIAIDLPEMNFAEDGVQNAIGFCQRNP